jgi:hypothetical protein
VLLASLSAELWHATGRGQPPARIHDLGNHPRAAGSLSGPPQRRGRRNGRSEGRSHTHFCRSARITGGGRVVDRRATAAR